MELQRPISYSKNQALIGRVLPVVIDRYEGGAWIGRTEFDSPEVDNEVLIDANKFYCRVGDFCTVKITDATDFDLYGEVVEHV